MKIGNESNTAGRIDENKLTMEYTQFSTRYDSEASAIWVLDGTQAATMHEHYLN